MINHIVIKTSSEKTTREKMGQSLGEAEKLGWVLAWDWSISQVNDEFVAVAWITPKEQENAVAS